jgi:spore coat polysaccharide biosynthesis predicted glycosyltransferase SpsG
VTLLTRTPSNAERVATQDVAVEPLPAGNEHSTLIDWVNSNNVKAVIIDTLDFDTDYQRQLNQTDSAVIVVLDDNRARLQADVVVNPNLYASELKYSWAGDEPVWCLGIEYLPLREPFCTFASETQSFPYRVEDIVVTMGGVDRENRTPVVLRALDQFDLHTTVIIGPGFDNSEEIRATAALCSSSVSVVENPEDLPQYFDQADLAVCTLGTTAYELLATQTPILGIPDNETPMPAALDELDAAIVLAEKPTAEDVSAGVSRVLEDTELRRQLWRVGGELVTGGGTSNLADAIETSFNS